MIFDEKFVILKSYFFQLSTKVRIVNMKQQANLIRAGWIIEHNGRKWTVLNTAITKTGKGGDYIQVEKRD